MTYSEIRLRALFDRLKPTGKKPKPIILSGEDRAFLFQYLGFINGLVQQAQAAAEAKKQAGAQNQS